MKPETIAISDRLRDRIKEGLEPLAEKLEFKDRDIPLGGGSRTLNDEQSLLYEALQEILEGKGYFDKKVTKLKKPDAELAREIAALKMRITDTVQGGTPVVFTNMPRGEALSLFTIGLMTQFGSDFDETRFPSTSKKRPAPPQRLNYAFQRFRGDDLLTHSTQSAHTDNSARHEVHLMAGKGEGSVPLPTNLFSVEEFLDKLEAIMRENGAGASREKIIGALTQPIWSHALTSEKPNYNVMLAPAAKGYAFLTSPKAYNEEKAPKWTQDLTQLGYGPTDIAFFSQVAKGIGRTIAELPNAEAGVCLGDNKLLVFNNRTVLHNAGRFPPNRQVRLQDLIRSRTTLSVHFQGPEQTMGKRFGFTADPSIIPLAHTLTDAWVADADKRARTLRRQDPQLTAWLDRLPQQPKGRTLF